MTLHPSRPWVARTLVISLPILILVAAAYCVRVTPALQPAPAAFDDGWRRTAQGWEQLSFPAFPRRMNNSSPSPQHPRRLSLCHPLLLAAGQVALIAAAYRVFPVRESTD